MELGITLPMVATSVATGALLGQFTEEVVAADVSGLSYCLIPEHHRGPANAISDPWTVAAWMLARTERIRVGPGVLLLPLHHPVATAERAALLQHASDGRLVLGLGAGYQKDDFNLFGTSHETRSDLFEEHLLRLRVHLGRDGDEDRAIPHLDRTFQPPLWIGAWSGAGLRRAAGMGDAWIADPARSVEEISRMAARYREKCEERRITPKTVVMREVWIGETDEAAWEAYLPAVKPVFGYYLRNGAIKLNETDDSGATDLEAVARQRAVVGSPGGVYDELREIESETGADVVICTLRQPGGPSHPEVVEAIQALGEVQRRIDEEG